MPTTDTRGGSRHPGLPVVFGGVFEQLPELQGVLADLLDRREKEASDGNVNHLLEETARLEEVLVAAQLHEAVQLAGRSRVGVTVLGVDREAFSLRHGGQGRQCALEISFHGWLGMLPAWLTSAVSGACSTWRRKQAPISLR